MARIVDHLSVEALEARILKPGHCGAMLPRQHATEAPRGRSGRCLSVVQIRVTPKARNSFTIKLLSISGVTWNWHVLNHAAAPFKTALRTATDCTPATSHSPTWHQRGRA